MAEHPILFSGPMVRAILDGRKTQTRRALRDQRPIDLGAAKHGAHLNKRDVHDHGKLVGHRMALVHCPYGVPVDLLWCKETHQYADWTEDGYPQIRYQADGALRWCENTTEEWSEKLTDIWAKLSEPANYNADGKAADRVWRPSIFMPRWASRITLEIAAVRVERLQEISQQDVFAEGLHNAQQNEAEKQVGRRLSPQDCYRYLWDSLNAKRAPWSSNPWVWVVEFNPTHPAIDLPRG